MKPENYIVIYDDEMGLECPMKWDDDCEGALCCAGSAVALFESKSDARKAIVISTRFAQLNQAQGNSVNEDFTTGLKNLRVIECRKKGGAK